MAAKIPRAITDMRVIGTIAPGTDTSPPTIPQGLTATAINKSRVDLAWTASTDDVAVAGYQIFRNGAALTTTVATSYSDTGCQPSTTYQYSVAAFDGSGNVSAGSSIASATTPSNRAPVWTSVPNQSLIIGNALTLTLGTYCSDADSDPLTFSIIAGTLPTGLTLAAGIISGTPTVAGQTPTVTVNATDGFANATTTIAFQTYSADITAPPVPTGLAASVISSSEIDLSWNASVDAAGSSNEFVSGTSSYRLYRNGSLRSTLSTLSYQDTGLVAATAYQYQIAAVDVAGNVSAQSAVISATTQSTTPASLDHPRSIAVLYGGDQSYGCNSSTGYQNWLTAPVGSAAYNFIQNVGAYDGAMLAGVFEGTSDWDSNHQRNRQNLTLALAKDASLTYQVKINHSRKTFAWYYHVMNEAVQTASGTGYDRRNAQLIAMNGWVFTGTGGSGSTVASPAGGGLVLSNYSTAWPSSIGSTPTGGSVVGAAYGSLSSGSPTGAQGVARMNGNYAAIKLMMPGYTGDPRFQFNAEMASKSCAGPLLDNCFYALDGAGNITNACLDGVNIANGSAPAYPTLNTPQEVLARGIYNFFDQIKTMVSTYGSAGSSVIPAGNMGQYCNKYEFGTACLTGGLANMMVMGFIEAAIGASYSPEWRIQPSAPTGNYALQLKDNLYLLQDFLVDHPQTPRRPVLAPILPPTSGTSTCQFPVLSGGVYVLQTVTSGSALEYQVWRYALCLALLCGADIGPSAHGYDYSTTRYYEELGDDSLTLINKPKGYLGQMTGTRPTAATIQGVWTQTYQGPDGTKYKVYWNPRGNGVQTIALGGTYKALLGTQSGVNNGASVTTLTLQDGDGRIMEGPISALRFLAAGHWQAAKMPLAAVFPRPDSETGAFTGTVYARNRLWYYDGTNDFNQEHQVDVQGGAHPHVYQLIQAPSWMSIGQSYGDPGYGVLSGKPTAAISKNSPQTVIIRVWGQDQSSIDITETIATSNSLADFLFLDSVNGNDSNNGSITAPFKTASKVMGTNLSSVTFSGARVFMKTGTYQWPLYPDATSPDGFHGYCAIDRTKVPVVYLTMPNSTVNIDASIAQIIDTGGGMTDLYFGGHSTSTFTITGSSATAGDTHTFEIYAANRCSWYLVKFVNPINRANGSNTNSSSIYTANAGGMKNYYSIWGCSETGRSGSAGNSMLMTSMFSVQNFCMKWCTISGTAGFGVFFKDSNINGTVLGNSIQLLPEASSNGTALLNGCQHGNATSNNVEFCFNFVRGGGIVLDFQASTVAGIQWSYRNTICSQNTNYPAGLWNFGSSGTGPYSSENDVIVSHSNVYGSPTPLGGQAMTKSGTEAQLAWTGSFPPTGCPVNTTTGTLVNVSGGTQYATLYSKTANSRGWEIG